MSNLRRTVFYVGMTNDLDRRVSEHKLHIIPGFTATYNCTDLVYFEETSDVLAAIAREKQLKGWRREKKLALIRKQNPNLDDFSNMSS